MNDGLIERQLRKIPGVLAVSTSIEGITVLVHPEVHALVIEAQASAVVLQLGDARAVAVIGGSRPATIGVGRNQFDVMPKLRTVAPAAALVGIAALVVGLAGSPVAWFHGLNPASSERHQTAAAPTTLPSSPQTVLGTGPLSRFATPPIQAPATSSATSAATAPASATDAGAATAAAAAAAPVAATVTRMPSGTFGAPVVTKSKSHPAVHTTSPATLLASATGLPPVTSPTGGTVAGLLSRPPVTTTPPPAAAPPVADVPPTVKTPVVDERDDDESAELDGHKDGDGDGGNQRGDLVSNAISKAVRQAVRSLPAQPPRPTPVLHQPATQPQDADRTKGKGRGRILAHLRGDGGTRHRH
jgi:hypothetical protein